MTAPQRCLTVAEVARGFGKTVAWFRKHRPALEARGFPAPLVPGSYDPEAIVAWRRAQMTPAMRAALTGQDLLTQTVTLDFTPELRANAERLAGALDPEAA
jgi:hypothetical protein